MSMATDAEKAHIHAQSTSTIVYPTMHTRAPLQPHQRRVVSEKTELDDKIRKLGDFLIGPLCNSLTAEDLALLIEQQQLMVAYSDTLMKRIVRFEPKAEQLAAFERAMVDVSEATDGAGKRVVLYRGPLTYEGLRHATFDFMEPFDTQAVFINGLNTTASQEQAEAAAWRNLALLARATAAALDAGL